MDQEQARQIIRQFVVEEMDRIGILPGMTDEEAREAWRRYKGETVEQSAKRALDDALGAEYVAPYMTK